MVLLAKSTRDHSLIPAMANRHGLIAGATGTGKTVTLQRMAEGFSRIGVPVFVADVKGDLAGIGMQGAAVPKIVERLAQLGIPQSFEAYPATYWDIFGEKGHPMRATVSEMGPLLLARLLDLNDIQTGVLSLAFRIADDQGLLLLDLNDLRAMLQYCGENAKEFTTSYGTIAPASVGAIQRALLSLEEQGGSFLFGEPAVAIADLMSTTSDGRGRINVLAADRLFGSPTMYATYLLWLLSELFEQMPEVGDTDKPKLVFFFDEAHLLFDDAPKALQDKIEQVVRLIRSKGIGVYFVTQNPLDIPDEILGQLGNRVQHALRAYTPRDQKAVKAAATTFRANPALDVESVITELAVGEALISLLDEKGRPEVVERAFVIPPHSRLGAITAEERAALVAASHLYGRYEKAVDRESAHEILKARAERALADAELSADAVERAKAEKQAAKDDAARAKAEAKLRAMEEKERAREEREAEKAIRAAEREQRNSPLDSMIKSATRAIGSTVGRQIVRGILGSILGNRR